MCIPIARYLSGMLSGIPGNAHLHSSPPLHVLDQVAQPSPHLLRAGQNLFLGQDESVPSCIPQLNRHAVRRLGHLKCIIYTIATDLVDGVTDGAPSERRTVNGLDSSNGAYGQGVVLCGIGDGSRAGVAVGVHPELAVRVDVHVECDTLASGDAVELGFERFGLYAVACGGTFVVLCAGRGGCTAALVPVRWPVT